MKTNLKRTLAVAMLAALAPIVAVAQGFPSKPIKVVVPFPPGAFNDTLGRTLAQEFSKGFAPGSQVDNKPGAGTVIGTDFVAKSVPDGHTILVVAFPFALLGSLHAHAKIDVTRDFAALAWVGSTPNLLVVHPSIPAGNLGEFIAHLKANPGQLNFGSAGNGSSQHLSGELFNALAGVRMTHVAYRGGAPAVNDLLGGQIQVIFAPLVEVIQQVRADKLRALGMTLHPRH